ncbi:MAG: tyrosine-type recombinase/integrase [Gammaproteobacteria bacterium]|nr:tyrosine-type recombinase/integrase [Gammaproteobacteria bacterium]
MSGFDAAKARALKDGRWLVYEGYSGLRLHCHGRARTWVYRYRSPVDARVRQIRLGRWPAVSWEIAVARWDDRRRQRDDGNDPQLDRRARVAQAKAQSNAARVARIRDNVTVERVIERYLDEHVAEEVKTEKGRYQVQWMMRRPIAKLGARPAYSIERGDASNFLLGVKSDAPTLARLLRSRLGQAWDHAIEGRMLPSRHLNPWRDALRGKLKVTRRSRYLDDSELAVFLGKVQTLENADVRDALLLTLFTATRSGEVIGMDWSAVDLKRGTWTLHTTKADEPRTIRLPRQALAILKRRGAGFEISQTALSGALRAAKSFRLRAFTPHDLRRSARTGFSRLGVRDEVAEAALGHVKGGIRGVYDLHAYEREVGEALQKWCDHLGALAAPEVVALPKSRAKN